jgi:hypothetical protein
MLMLYVGPCASNHLLNATCYYLTGKAVPVLNYKSIMLRRHVGKRRCTPLFLTSTLDGGEWSASLPCRFSPKERHPAAHWIGGPVGPSVCVDVVERREYVALPRRELGPCSVLSTTIPTLRSLIYVTYFLIS